MASSQSSPSIILSPTYSTLSSHHPKVILFECSPLQISHQKSKKKKKKSRLKQLVSMSIISNKWSSITYSLLLEIQTMPQNSKKTKPKIRYFRQVIYIRNLHYLLLPNILCFNYFFYLWTFEFQLCPPNRNNVHSTVMDRDWICALFLNCTAHSEVTASIPDLLLEDRLFRRMRRQANEQ